MLSIGLDKRRIALSLSALLAILVPVSSYATPADAESNTDTKPASSSSDGDIFSTHSWSIVPAGSATEPVKRVQSSENKTIVAPEKTQAQYSQSKQPQYGQIKQLQYGQVKQPQSSAAAIEPAPLKLYGRIEELCNSSGAKIPLKMHAMTPIRDSSLDAKLAAKTVKLVGKTTMIASGQQSQWHPPAPEASFPFDYRGTWSGEMTVYMVDFDSSYFDFDRAEAEQQQRLITTGRKGRCSVTFYQGSNNKTEMQPTQIVFSAPMNKALQEMSQGNPTLAALAGLVGGGNNSMLPNTEIPEFALPLGSMSSGQGVTQNQLTSELMKNTLKEISKDVLEEQVVTRDTDRNKSGQVKNTFSESDLRFTKMDSSKLYLQAAAVSYDNQGNYLNKIILTGTLDKGAPVTNSSPSQIDIYGGAGAQDGSDATGGSNPLGNFNPFGGSNSLGGSSPMGGSNPLGGSSLFGGSSPLGGSDGSSNPLGNMQPMLGGDSSDAGAGDGTSKVGEQMKQLQKMLKDMGGQQ